MKIILLTYILQIVLCNNIYAQNSWKRLADFPTIRYKAAAFSIGNKGYVGTGLTPDSLKNDLWEYDPDKNTWKQMASLPAPGRQGAVGFSINQKGYLGSGSADSGNGIAYFANDFWEYDPAINKWTQKADIPINNIGVTGTIVSFSVRDMSYIKSSFNDQNFFEYDPVTNSWTTKENFPGIGQISEVGFSIGLKGYIGTGFAEYNNTQEFWEYDPSEDKWTQKADFPGAPRNGAVGFNIGNYDYIGLGNAGGKFQSDFWRYDPSSDSWTQIDSCGYGVDGAFSFSIKEKGYVGTGVFIDVGEFWEYDSGVTSVQNNNDSKINKFSLYQNYPNPFNPVTTIQYEIPKESFVKIIVYDVLGREVKELLNEEKPKGIYEITFNGSGLASGTYFYQLKTENYIETKKMQLMK
jgi:N-acetylneuraminic acid mutarotase